MERKKWLQGSEEPPITEAEVTEGVESLISCSGLWWIKSTQRAIHPWRLQLYYRIYRNISSLGTVPHC